VAPLLAVGVRCGSLLDCWYVVQFPPWAAGIGYSSLLAACLSAAALLEEVRPA
jgi:hypothetical protein